jgi:dienelactone hydrolase
MIVGFSWGGWTTASTTDKIAAQAVLDSQAAICVAQFKNQANYAESLSEFEKVDDYKKDEYIQKGGWDKMPGQEKADSNVCQPCANGVRLLIKKKS